jgi:hypothetical protein|tara:strand:+ start:113 stop:451 length:339 start_codon:yes stop_codon:yes gene_type:complete
MQEATLAGMTHEAMPVAEFNGLSYAMERHETLTFDGPSRPPFPSSKFYHDAGFAIVRGAHHWDRASRCPNSMELVVLESAEGSDVRETGELFPARYSGRILDETAPFDIDVR